MKRITYITICFVLINTSCKKTKNDVHFHGRVTVDCDSQVPVKNLQLIISRQFDTGSYQHETIGTAVTDDNGYYSLITDVKQEGSFMNYSLRDALGSLYLFDRHYGCQGNSSNNSTDVEMNGTAYPQKAHGFHIKNVTPFNNADVFNSLTLSDHYRTYDNDTLISNLIGTNIDTFIYRFFTGDPPVYGKHLFTKNGITDSSFNTITNPNCLDTINFDIFY